MVFHSHTYTAVHHVDWDLVSKRVCVVWVSPGDERVVVVVAVVVDVDVVVAM